MNISFSLFYFIPEIGSKYIVLEKTELFFRRHLLNSTILFTMCKELTRISLNKIHTKIAPRCLLNCPSPLKRETQRSSAKSIYATCIKLLL